MRIGRRAYVIFCWAYLIALPIQIALAGYGVMGGDIEMHENFGYSVLHAFIPLLLLLAALVGRAWSLAGWALALFAILTLQIALPEIGDNLDSNWVQGLHPLLAFLTWPFVYFVLLRSAKAKVAEAEQVVVAETVPA